MNKTFKKILLGAIIFLSFLMIPMGSASAASDKNTISAKAVLEGAWQCLSGGAIGSSFKASNPDKFIINNLSSNTVKLPYGWTDVADNNLNCKELMFGYGSASSGVKAGLVPESIEKGTIHDVAKFFAGDSLDGTNGVGYSATVEAPDAVGDGQKLTFTMKTGEDESRACGGGELKTPGLTVGGSSVSAIVFPTVVKNASGGVVASSGESYNVPDPGSGGRIEFVTTCGVPITVEDQGTASAVVYNIVIDGLEYAKISGATSGSGAVYSGSFNWNYMRDTGVGVYLEGKTETVAYDGGDYAEDYTLNWGHSNNYLSGLNKKNTTGYSLPGDSIRHSDLALTEQEVFDLYRYYITDIYQAPVACKGDSNYDAYESAGMPYVVWKKCSCRIDKGAAKNPSPANLYGVDSSRHFTATVDLDAIIAGLNSLNSGLLEMEECGEDTEEGGSGGGGGSATDPGMTKPGGSSVSSSGIVDCNKLENIGAMQWILCPVMNNEQYTASWIDNQTQEWLEVDTKIYTGSEIEDVWGNIRNIANVMMIVFLLAIVFSQVTGYGIDNYGVKKMLPRLIVMAILINLSLYICQMAVDLSNIAGVGLRNMFTSIGMGSGSGTAGTSFLGNMIMGMFASASAGGAAAVSGFSLAVALGAEIAIAVVVAVIVLLLVVLVAVMVLFLMLGAREIIIIVCIIMSPLAFAAFILPNTQNLFKKWWELFKAALIIFPICGAMAGISNMLRSMYSTGSSLHMWGYAVLMVLPYLGFFLMPMLLKNAISALGKVGGALTSLGNTVKNGGKAIGQGAMKIGQNTEAFKTMQAEAARRRQSESAERTINKMKQIKDRNGSLNDAQKRQLARAHEVQRKLGNEDTAASTILMEKEYAGQSQEKMIRDWNEAFDSGDTGRMDALTNVIVSRYGPGGVNSIAKRFDGKEIFEADGSFVGGENGNMAKSFMALQSNMMQNKGLATAMQNKASDVYQMISSGGYVDRDADGNAILDAEGKQTSKRQNLAAHSANNSMATQIKDWATQSSATLERAAASGALTPDTMREILDSSDPAVQSGIKSDADKRRILEAGASGFNGNWKDKGAVAQAAQQYKSSVTHEREAKEYEQTWQTLLNQRDQAEMASNVSRIANAVSPQGGARGTSANTTAAGAQNASLNAGAKATASGGATNSIKPNAGSSNTGAVRPQVSAASSIPAAGGFGTSGNTPLFNPNNYIQAPRVPQGSGAQGTSGSRSVTPPQGGSIPRENSGAPKVDWNARARGDKKSDEADTPKFGESGTNHGGPDSWTRSQTARNDQADRNNQNRQGDKN